MNPIPQRLKENSFSSFLRAYFLFVRKQLGGEQVKKLALTMGVTSRITFKYILRGKKELNAQQLSKTQDLLDLSHRERLDSTQFSSDNNSRLEENYFYVSEDFFNTPLNTITLNFCSLKKPMSIEQIQDSLKSMFEQEEVKESVDLLIKLKLIEKQGDGSLKRIFHGSLSNIPGIKSSASRNYFSKTYQLADLSWQAPLHLRELNSFTVRLDFRDIPKLKDLIRKLRQDISDLSSRSESNSIYQCSIAAAPIHIEK